MKKKHDTSQYTLFSSPDPVHSLWSTYRPTYPTQQLNLLQMTMTMNDVSSIRVCVLSRVGLGGASVAHSERKIIKVISIIIQDG